jgi:hypothetical protein
VPRNEQLRRSSVTNYRRYRCIHLHWRLRLGCGFVYALVAKAGAVMTEKTAWIIVLCPLILIFLASLAFGPSAVSAVFEAVFHRAAWVVAVWVAVLEAV